MRSGCSGCNGWVVVALVWLKMGKFVELAQTILLFIVEQNPENEIALSKDFSSFLFL